MSVIMNFGMSPSFSTIYMANIAALLPATVGSITFESTKIQKMRWLLVIPLDIQQPPLSSSTLSLVSGAKTNQVVLHTDLQQIPTLTSHVGVKPAMNGLKIVSSTAVQHEPPNLDIKSTKHNCTFQISHSQAV